MRFPNATLRKNGKVMMTTKVEFHFSLEDILNVVRNDMSMYFEEEKMEKLHSLTKAKIWEDTIRMYLANGRNWTPENLDNEDDEDAAIVEHVKSLFPELV